jgi:hypothetical protein
MVCRPAPFPEWELRTIEHGVMKRECELMAMGKEKEEGGGLSNQNEELPQTVLHASGQVCPRCDDRGGAQGTDTQLMYEYDQLRNKHQRLESKYESLQARELRLVGRLPKIAQYELAALPHPWTAHLHPLGRTFYFNHESGVSSWHDPRLVPSPRVEGCPQLKSWAEREGQDDQVPNSEVQGEDVGRELWGDRAGAGAPQDAAWSPPPVPVYPSHPSRAKLTGLPIEAEKRVLSESELHLPWRRYAPAEEDRRPSSRQSGIILDSPKGSHVRGKLQVSGPILVARRSVKNLVGKGNAKEEEHEALREDMVFNWDLRTVALDGDRLWLSTADSPVFPWEQPAEDAQDSMEDDERGSNEDRLHLDLNMESIPLWKARLEIMYPVSQDNDVSNLLWGEDGLGAMISDTNISAKISETNNSAKISEITSRSGSDAKEPGAGWNARLHVFEKGFTRWRVLDRLSRYWVFQSRSKHEAREWVMSLTHNMLLVESGRIRPSNFHILAPQTGDAHSLSPAGNVSAESRLKQIQEELLQTTHMLQHTRNQLRDCLKSHRSRPQPTGGKGNTENGNRASGSQKPQAASSRMDAMPLKEGGAGTAGLGQREGGQGEAFGRILHDLASIETHAYVRQVLRLRNSDVDNVIVQPVLPFTGHPLATVSSDSSPSSSRASSQITTVDDGESRRHGVHRKKEQAAQDTAKQMIDGMIIDDVERLAHWIISEDEGGTLVRGAGAAAEADITLEQGLKFILKSVGGVIDDACPALYPTYVSFLHAQVTPERERAPSHFCPYPFISQNVCVHVQIMNMRACGPDRRKCRNLIHAHMGYKPCY